MIDKIRLSLWDIFTFFASGFLIAVIAAGHLLYLGYFEVQQATEFLISMTGILGLFVFLLLFLLTGMLLEPISNYFDKLVINRIFGAWLKQSESDKKQEEVIVSFIKSNCLGELNGKIDNPYFLCKEYVETKQLSTTLMSFLSKFGFYRNVAFVSMICAVLAFFIMPTWPIGIGFAAFWLLMAIVFKKRANDFYGYQAPSVYHAFLIDKLSWAKELPEEKQKGEVHE